MAQHLFWETSGLSKFEFQDTQVRDKEQLMKDICKHVVTAEDVERCVNEFKNRMDHDKLIIRYCGACGVLVLDNNYDILNLSDLTSLILEQEVYTCWKAKSAELRCLYSIHEEKSTA
jgi:hypothetical protein